MSKDRCIAMVLIMLLVMENMLVNTMVVLLLMLRMVINTMT